MSTLEKAIEKICRFSFYFTNMDTVFINRVSQVEWEFVHYKMPDQLKSYFADMYHRLKLQELNSSYDVYFHSSNTRMNYISTRIYDFNGNYIGSIVVGPYLLEEPTDLIIHEVLFENKLSISLKHTITQYYMTLPLISTYKAKIIGDFLFNQTVGVHSISFQLPRIGSNTYHVYTDFAISPEERNIYTDLSVDILEKRYHIQNEIMNAVAEGDIELAEKMFIEIFPTYIDIPERIPNNPIRSQKNTTFVFNTMLRIAAEKGGLHPLYLHNISEKYAIKIEKTTTLQQLYDLRQTMLREYCEAVKKYSLKDFSYITRNAIGYIRKNLNQDLSLTAISSAIEANSYELSRIFKKETRQSLTDFINTNRINESLHFMENRKLSITDIAQMVGFNDSNYFTKVFKKFKGVTPSQFRNGII